MNDCWLVLLDIDGTLLTTEGAGPRLMQRAADGLFGAGRLCFEAVDFSGNLDPLIVAEAAERSGHAWDEGHHGRFREAYLSVLAEWVAVTRPGLLPGASELVAALHRAGVATGLLTGNYPEAARLKLEAAGLDFERFGASAFGDDAPDRPGLLAVARERHGIALEPGRVVVVGDTPRDIGCAKAHDCVAVGVATGRFGRGELEAAGADLVLDSLEGASAALSGLGLVLVEPGGRGMV